MKNYKDLKDLLKSYLRDIVDCNVISKGHQEKNEKVKFKFQNKCTKKYINVTINPKRSFLVQQSGQLILWIDLRNEKMIEKGLPSELKSKLIEYGFLGEGAKFSDTLKRLLKEDHKHINFENMLTILDVYRNSPYFRCIVKIPNQHKLETFIKVKVNIEQKDGYLFSHKVLENYFIGDITEPELESSYLESLPDRNFVVIYYEYFLQHKPLTITNFPIKIYIPISEIVNIKLTKQIPTFEAVKQSLGKFFTLNSPSEYKLFELGGSIIFSLISGKRIILPIPKNYIFVPE